MNRGSFRRVKVAMSVLIYLLFFIAGIFPPTVSAQTDEIFLTVSPPVVEMATNRGDHKSFTFQLTNNAISSREVEVGQTELALDEKGDYRIENKECQIADWLSVDSSFMVLPNEEKDITVTIKVPPEAKTGSYHCLFLFKNSQTTEEMTSLTGEKVLPMRAQMGGVFLLTVGNSNLMGRINKITVPNLAYIAEPLSGSIFSENLGNNYFHTQLMGYVKDIRGNIKETFRPQNDLVLPLSTRETSFTLANISSWGYHTISVELYLEGSRVSVIDKGIVVLPSKQSIILTTVATVLLLAVFYIYKKPISRRVAIFSRKIGYNLNSRQQKIMQIVRKNGYVTNRDIQDKLHISNKTAYLELKDMVEKKYLREEGYGRNVRYILSEQ